MIFKNNKLRFLGMEPKTAKGSGKHYFMAKFMEEGTAAVFEFYVSGERIVLITELGKLSPFSEVMVDFELTAYQGKNEVGLLAVGK